MWKDVRHHLWLMFTCRIEWKSSGLGSAAYIHAPTWTASPMHMCFFLTSTDPHFHWWSASFFLRPYIRTLADTIAAKTDWLVTVDFTVAVSDNGGGGQHWSDQQSAGEGGTQRAVHQACTDLPCAELDQNRLQQWRKQGKNLPPVRRRKTILYECLEKSASLNGLR